MEGKDVNLNEIHNLPESEFRKHFAQWVEEDGVARALQAKLRKDLFETFSRTHLGRRIYAMYSKANRMILSPLILALNTLVAEFLYAQNCHFSLSVFSTEVPYRNTLPDFESLTPFRFTQSEIIEIFEAVSTDISPEFQTSILECYLNKPSPKGCMSLLYLIFKNIFKFKQKAPTEVHAETKSAAESNRSATSAAKSVTSKDRTDTEASKGKDDESIGPQAKRLQYDSFYNNQFRYLNKYLIILSRKVKEMSNSLEQLEKREIDSSRVKRKSLQTRKMENLSRSLEKISENLRVLSLSKRKNRKMSVIISAIDKLAQQLEKCSENFQTMSRSMREGPLQNLEKSEVGEKTYSEWIKELTSTKSGKKFVAKVEAALRQTLEEEKEKLAQAFEQKLEDHKALVKLKYKQKFLLRLEAQTASEKPSDKSNEIRGYIERRLDDLSKKHDELLKNIQERNLELRKTEAALNKQSDSLNKKQEEEAKEKPEKIQEITEKKLEENAETKEAKAAEKNQEHTEEREVSKRKPSAKKKLFREEERDNERIEHFKLLLEKDNSLKNAHSSKAIDLKPQLEEMTRAIAEQERNIDAIIHGAKLRVQELEFESNQLDRSFQDFIEKQHDRESKLEENAAKIIRNYKIRKSRLKLSELKKWASNKSKTTKNSDSFTSDQEENGEISSAETLTSIDERPPRIPSPPDENPLQELQNEFLAKDFLTMGNQMRLTGEVAMSQALEYVDAGTSPLQDTTKENAGQRIKIVTYTFKNQDEATGKNFSPASSELNLQDASLDDIVLSDTRLSEKSHSSDKLSMALKVPKVVLTRSGQHIQTVPSDLSNSPSEKIHISTGGNVSPDDHFWD